MANPGRQPSSTRQTASRKALAMVTRTTGLTASGLVLLGFALGAWVLGRVIGGRPLYVIAYFLILVLGMAYAIGRRQPAVEGARSTARARLTEGEAMGMTVQLSSERRVNTVILEERVPEALGEPVLVPVAAVSAEEPVEHDYKVSCRRRGSYELGPLVVKWGDPLGLTRREATLVEPVELLVHPRVESVDDRPLTRMFEDPPFRPPISKPWPQGMEFYGMRQYSMGDDVRRIVWRAFARTGQLLVREAEQGITDKVTILLDQDANHHGEEDPSPSFETAIRVAASLGVRHLRDGFSVTLEGSEDSLIPTLRGPSARIQLLDALARVERVRAPLSDAVARVVRETGRNQHLVVVTPRLDFDAAGRLDMLTQRGTSVLIAALMFGEESPEALSRAASLGAQVIEVRPRVPLSLAFRHIVGAGIGVPGGAR